MKISIMGKSSFLSKNGKECYLFHCAYECKSVDGYAVNSFFTNKESYESFSSFGSEVDAYVFFKSAANPCDKIILKKGDK